ncbi:MAG: lauroyl acyltransferase [Gammaproteobacteria bacterium]|nr:MAG: lauroyl acyltransferase [Gammaproteobacteria bacterium]RLA53965.1 MAG: lauroyl acyltransferase [Gammaproteobacteria bacterium]
MTQFIFGNSLKDKLNRWPVVRNTIWKIEAIVLTVLLRILSWLPVAKASSIGAYLGRALGTRIAKHQMVITNLSLAFPEKSVPEIEQLAGDVWANGGAVVAEFANIKKICRSDRLKIAVAGYIEGFNRKDRPVILVTAHFSNWEIAAAAAGRMVQPLSAPFTPPNNPYLGRMLSAHRQALGVNLLARDVSIRPLFKQIAGGHSIAFIMDQRVDSGKPVPFMGMDKMTTLVPARLGLRFNCEIVPVRAERLSPANYLITFYPPVVADDDDAGEEERALQVTTKINQLFESWIRERPQEWFCASRRWPKIRKNKSLS